MKDNDILQAIGSLVQDLHTLRNRAFNQYSAFVGQVLNGQISDIQSIEQIMDGLLDFCDEERFINIYRQLCRHIYYQYSHRHAEDIDLISA